MRSDIFLVKGNVHVEKENYTHTHISVKSFEIVTPSSLYKSQQISDRFHCARRQALSLNHLYIPVAIGVRLKSVLNV